MSLYSPPTFLLHVRVWGTRPKRPSLGAGPEKHATTWDSADGRRSSATRQLDRETLLGLAASAPVRTASDAFSQLLPTYVSLLATHFPLTRTSMGNPSEASELRGRPREARYDL